MDTGAVVALVIAGVALLVILALIAKKSREKRLESRRVEAHEVRREARIHGAQADRDRADADVRSAQARKEQAIAEEKAARAEKRGRFARERRERADELDPDVEEERSTR
jgi:biopolymer transport protein ExbB/TolQ